MKHWAWPAVVAGIFVVLLAGCGGAPVQPLAFNPAPWTVGEISDYVLLDSSGTQIGTATWQWQRSSAYWQQNYVVTVNGLEDRGSVVIDGELQPVRATRDISGTRYEASYLPDEIRIVTTKADGAATTKSLKPVTDGIDNDASLQVQRALPLAAGYATRYTDVIITTGLTAPIKLSVTGAETITVPAGVYATWRVEMSFGSGKHDAWYGQAAPYPLVKYVNRASGAAFELSSLTVTGDGATSAAPVPPAPKSPTPAQGVLPPINVPLLLATFLVQMPLMIVFPLVLGGWIRRRYGVGWGVFGIGAATFIASQIVHIPLNYALGLLTGGRGIGLWPRVPLALAAGLSAGICEEGARWLMLRLFAKKTRGWRAGLQFGAGHGGAEAIIFGVLALINVVILLVLRSLDATALGLPADAARQLHAGQVAFWRIQTSMPLLAGFERLCAIALQISMALLVMRAVTQRNLAWLVAAVGLHAAVDFWAVWSRLTFDAARAEAGLVPLTVFALWLIWRLRETPPAVKPASASPPMRTAADLAPHALTPEELARRADASKYE